MAHSEAEIAKQVRAYMIVFAALWTATVITVAVSYLHLPTPAAVTLALLIATVKGSLVACYFMHLIDEKKFIYWVLGITVIFFAALLFGPALTAWDQVRT